MIAARKDFMRYAAIKRIRDAQCCAAEALVHQRQSEQVVASTALNEVQREHGLLESQWRQSRDRAAFDPALHRAWVHALLQSREKIVMAEARAVEAVRETDKARAQWSASLSQKDMALALYRKFQKYIRKQREELALARAGDLLAAPRHSA
jgi:hypothetical protein